MHNTEAIPDNLNIQAQSYLLMSSVLSLHLLTCILHLSALITKVSIAHYIYCNKVLTMTLEVQTFL